MSKIESGRIEFEEKQFSLPDVLSSISSGLSSLASDKGIELTTQFSHIGKLQLIGDQNRLRQILWNLLTNAIKFTAKGQVNLLVIQNGAILPAAASTPLPKNRDNIEVVRFSVIDTGIGISKDRIATIFDPFVQADGSTTRKFGGSGLGLSIVHRLIKSMGGHIEISSDYGHGTQFDIWIPFEKIPQASLVQDEGDDIHDSKNLADSNTSRAVKVYASVLLAEDNEVNARVAILYFEKLGMRVTHAINGQIAVELMREQDFDLIFMDAHMPEMDGEESTREIRAMENSRKATIPIIGLTAEAFVERHKKLLDAGMNSVMTKPIDKNHLIKIITEYLPSADNIVSYHRPLEKVDRHSEPAINSTPATNTVIKEVEDAPLVDKVGLKILMDNAGRDQISVLLFEAPNEVGGQIAKLGEAIKNEDHKATFVTAHTIKGIASSLCAPKLRNISVVVEDCAAKKIPAHTVFQELEKIAQETFILWRTQTDTTEQASG